MTDRFRTIIVMVVMAALLVACSREPSQHSAPDTVQQIQERAERGDATAQNMLGGMYYKGEGVPQNYKQAAYWAQKAAEQGRADAQANLAIMYYKGQGVTQDFQQAYIWWRLATDQTDVSLGNDIDNVGEKLSPEQLSEARKRIAEIQKQTGAPPEL